MYEQLYVKRGRRYVPWGIGDSGGNDWDAMKAGSFRLIYCPEAGLYQHRFDIDPLTVEWAAASMVAEHAMVEAMASRAIASPRSGEHTPAQLKLIEKFRLDMAAEGALLPTWWNHSTPVEIARAGIEAVMNYD